jgi:hypothetical protein
MSGKIARNDSSPPGRTRAQGEPEMILRTVVGLIALLVSSAAQSRKFVGEFHGTSLFNFRRPQCSSFRDGLNTRSTWHKGGMEKKEGQPITVLSEAVVVPSGVVRLMELQEKGWSYVRP